MQKYTKKTNHKCTRQGKNTSGRRKIKKNGCLWKKTPILYVFSKGLFFSVEYLGIAVNSLKDQNMKIKYDGGIITVCGGNDISNKVMAIVGKKEV